MKSASNFISFTSNKLLHVGKTAESIYSGFNGLSYVFCRGTACFLPTGELSVCAGHLLISATFFLSQQTEMRME